MTPSTGVNFFQADGDGFFDIKFLFADTNGPNIKFGSGDEVSFVITSSEVITANSFNFLSVMSGGQGLFFTAAQIQGIGSEAFPDADESGWIGHVPEPSSAVLLILGAIALLPIARRRIKR